MRRSFAVSVAAAFAAGLLLGLASCGGGDEAPGLLTLEQALALQWGDLEYEVVTSMPEGQTGGRAIVFLHGYGRSGPAYADFARELLDDDTRIILPTAALPHPAGEGGMWWEFLDEDWPKPWPVHPDAPEPPKPSQQLPKARDAVIELVARVRERYRPDELVLAGHSQGAMLALDTMLWIEPPVDRVVLLSGYVLLDSVPRVDLLRDERAAVFVSHGRTDRTVAFKAAEDLRILLQRNGFDVTFAPHDGGHGIDARVTQDVRDFLRTGAGG